MNLTELRTAIASYTENEFSNTDLDTFIVQAEERINNSVQLPAARKTATLNTFPYTPWIDLPSDYLYTYSLAVEEPVTMNSKFLLQKDPSFVQEAFPDGQYAGFPTHYAQTGPYRFILGPIPDTYYTVLLVYFGYPVSITVAPTGRTWLGDNGSSALLYGSLVEAYTFMKGEQDMMAVYDAKYKEALALLKQLADAKIRQDSYRAGQVRYPVT